MDKLEEILLEWWEPISQGLIACVLFWAVTTYIPKIYESIRKIQSKRSLVSKRKILAYEIAKYRAMTLDGAESTRYIASMTYSVIKDVVQGLVWLSLGLITQSIVDIFGVVGFLGALFYFLRAADGVRPVDTNINKDTKLKELEKELSVVVAELNKSSKRDAETGAPS